MIPELNDNFEYERLDSEFTEKEIRKNFNSLSNSFSESTKEWDISLNTDWILRDYLAAKMILSSTVFINSIDSTETKNIKIVEPYLIYYSLLNCSRAVLLTSPINEWKDGKLFELSHQKTINTVCDIISKYNEEKGQKIKKTISLAKEYREIFSYKFPANGLINFNLSLNECIDICKLLSEIAQFQSKVLENSVSKHVHNEFEVDFNVLYKGFFYGESNLMFIDNEDYNRLGYLGTKQKRPYSLHATMTEGMVEDFFDYWCHEDDEVYNPNGEWQIIFPVP